MIDNKQLDINQKITIIISILIIISISSILSLSVSVFVMQVFLGIITIPLILRRDYKTSKLYLIILLISILFIFLVYYANQLYYGNPYYIGGSDDLRFEQWGFDIYNSNIYMPHKVMKLGIIGMYHNSPFYAVFIALLIKFSSLFGGYNSFLPRFMNAYFLIWVCMIIEYLLKKYTNLSKRAILLTIAGFAMMPNIQYINSHVFRDTLNMLQIFLIILTFERIFSNRNFLHKISNIFILPILVYITYYTRVNSLAFAGVIILLTISEFFNIKKRYIALTIVPLIFASDILNILGLERFIKGYSSYVLNIAGDGLSSFVFRQPLLPLGVVFRVLYAFITPFPNFFGLFKDSSKLLFDFVSLLIYLGVMVQVLVVPFIIKRIFKFDWLSFSFLSWFLAVIISTFTFRHVIFYYPFMVAVAVDGYLKTKLKTRKVILFLSSFTVICFGLIYLSLKVF